MAIAVDDSTVARWGGTGTSFASGSFTASSGALLVVCITSDGDAGAIQTTTCTDSGGLTWTKRVERNEFDGGYGNVAAMFTAQTVSSVSRTVTIGVTNSKPISAKLYIVTGHNTTTPVGEVGGGSSTTQNLTADAYVSSANNSRAFGCAHDWSNGTGASSSDTEDAAADDISLYKSADTATAGTSVTVNFNQTSAPQWTWCALEVLAAGETIVVYPWLFAAGALFAAAAGTSITPVIPANDAADDIGIMACMCNAASTFTTPTNWTLFGTSVNSANQSTAWFWKRLSGSDGNPTSTTSATGSATIGLYGRIWVWRGCVATGTPFEDETNAGTPTLSTTPATAVIDTTDTNRRAVGFVMVDDDNPWTAGTKPPPLWHDCGDRVTSTTGGDAMFDAIQRVITSASTVAAVTIGTQASDYWRTMTLAFIPASTGPSPITGTVAVTLGTFASAASGTYTPPPITGSVAVTLGSFVPTAAGTYTPPPITGTVAVTLAPFVSTASGTVAGPGVTGTVAVTLGSFISTASGTYTPPPVTGTVAVTLGPFVSAASGTVAGPGAITGTVAVTLGTFTSSASGTVGLPAITGTVTVTLGSFTSTAAGTVTGVFRTGTVAVTLNPFTSTASGTANAPAVTGTVAVTLDPFLCVAFDVPPALSLVRRSKVRAENRIAGVAAENRVTRVHAENRIVGVAAEDRITPVRVTSRVELVEAL